MKKKLIIVIFFLVAIIGTWRITETVFAEQNGNTPESGATSRLKSISDALISLGFGSTSSGGWGDWGAMWNRIYSAATWTPNGSATPSEIASCLVSGKTFYAGNSRSQYVGTKIDYGVFPKQSYCVYNDSMYPCIQPQSATGSESWSNTATNVWKDNRTGLYWTEYKGSMTNNFSQPCAYFSYERGEWTGSGCGNAIDYCTSLSQVAVTGQNAKTNWYLPSNNEMRQAYIDGMYSKTSPEFATTNNFWSTSALGSGSTNAYYLSFETGVYNWTARTSSYPVRCVSRD